MDGWDVAVVVVAGYISVITLARLMRQHRDKMVADLRREIDEQRKRQRAEQLRLEAEQRIKERAERRKKRAA